VEAGGGVVAHGWQLQAVARLDCSLPLVFHFAFSSLHYQASSPSTLPIPLLLNSLPCFKLPPFSPFPLFSFKRALSHPKKSSSPLFFFRFPLLCTAVLGAIYRAKWVGLLTVAHGSRASGGWSAIGCYCRGSTPTAWGLGLRNSVKTTLFKFFFFSFFYYYYYIFFFYLWGPKNGLQQ